jgi:hypothetical protein
MIGGKGMMRGDVDGAKDGRQHPFYAQIPGCIWHWR